jgi:hypothetical protein
MEHWFAVKHDQLRLYQQDKELKANNREVRDATLRRESKVD